MKIFTIFLLILLGHNQARDIHIDNFIYNQQTHLKGSWHKCKSEYNGHIVMSNVCQTINLDDDGTGKLLLGDELICVFKWKIEKNSIKFSFDSSRSQSHFLYGVLEYKFKLYDKEDFQYLELKPQDEDIVYFLTRVK